MEAAVLLKKKERHQCEVRDSRIGGFFIIIMHQRLYFSILSKNHEAIQPLQCQRSWRRV